MKRKRRTTTRNKTFSPRGARGSSKGGEAGQQEEKTRPDSGGEKGNASFAIYGDKHDLKNGGGGAKKYLTAPQHPRDPGVQRRHHRALSPHFYVAAKHLAVGKSLELNV